MQGSDSRKWTDIYRGSKLPNREDEGRGKEVLEHFAGVFTMMNPLTFKGIFQTTVPYMVERISKNYALPGMTLLSYVLSTCVEYSVFLLFLSNVLRIVNK